MFTPGIWEFMGLLSFFLWKVKSARVVEDEPQVHVTCPQSNRGWHKQQVSFLWHLLTWPWASPAWAPGLPGTQPRGALATWHKATLRQSPLCLCWSRSPPNLKVSLISAGLNKVLDANSPPGLLHISELNFWMSVPRKSINNVNLFRRAILKIENSTREWCYLQCHEREVTPRALPGIWEPWWLQKSLQLEPGQAVRKQFAPFKNSLFAVNSY